MLRGEGILKSQCLVEKQEGPAHFAPSQHGISQGEVL